MKRLMIILAVLFLLCSCSAPENPSLLDMSEETAMIESRSTKQYPYSSPCNLGGYYIETALGDYYLRNDTIYFSPAGETSFFPLCNKPNCTHGNKNCNAYGGWAIGYYNGFLYSVQDDPDMTQTDHLLIRMDPDGSNHTEIMKLPWESYADGSRHSSCDWFFCKNRLIISSAANFTQPLEEQIHHLYVVDLDTLEITEPFAELLSAPRTQIGVLRQFVDDLFYTIVELPKDSGQTTMEIQVYDRWLYELNLETGSSRPLLCMDGILTWTVQDGTVYYLESGVFCEQDLESGEVVRYDMPIEDAWWASWDEDVVYVMGHGSGKQFLNVIDEKHTLYFFDREYHLIDQVELTDYLFLGFVSEKYLLFSDNRAVNPVSYYLDKSQIGSGDLELLPLNP